VLQDAQGMILYGEAVGGGHRRWRYVRHGAIPHADRILKAAKRLVAAAAAAENIAVDAPRTVHLRRQRPRVLRHSRVGAITDQNVERVIRGAGEHILLALVRLHEVAATGDGKA